MNIAVITPLRKRDYLADTILDGLLSLQTTSPNLNFVISSKYPFYSPLSSNVLGRNEFISYARQADIMLFIWGKRNTDINLANEIGLWDKTIFIDGSEVGGNLRLDPEIQRVLEEGSYKGQGKVDQEMLSKCALYFKREKPYPSGVLPLPFGIESRYSARYKPGMKKDIEFFCVFGQLDYPPFRKEVFAELVSYCNKHNFLCHTKRTKTQDEFWRLLARSQVGISVGGGGFDTIRFWETLGANCLLMTETIAIFRPEDHALEYDRMYEFGNIDEFKSQLEKVSTLLRNGYDEQKFIDEYNDIMKKHSSRARVEYVLSKARKKGFL